MKTFYSVIMTLIVISSINHAQSQSDYDRGAIYQALHCCPYIDENTGERCKGRVRFEMITPTTTDVVLWQNRCSKGHKWITKNDDQTPLK